MHSLHMMYTPDDEPHMRDHSERARVNDDQRETRVEIDWTIGKTKCKKVSSTITSHQNQSIIPPLPSLSCRVVHVRTWRTSRVV